VLTRITKGLKLAETVFAIFIEVSLMMENQLFYPKQGHEKCISSKLEETENF